MQVVGPSLRDLKDRVDVDYEEISRAMIAHSVGVVLGSLAGGLLYDRVPRRHSDLFLVVGFVIQAVGTVAMPWSNSLALVATFFFITGISKGIIDIGKEYTLYLL